MITISEKAKNKLSLLSREEGDKEYLRIGVKGGGCSGLSYQMSFENSTNEEDEIFENQGIKIAVDRKSLLYLLGTELDFSDGLNGKGFHFINPNATRTCGCGESFSL
jgi:iron-sulfur cluster assembly protein